MAALSSFSRAPVNARRERSARSGGAEARSTVIDPDPSRATSRRGRGKKRATEPASRVKWRGLCLWREEERRRAKPNSPVQEPREATAAAHLDEEDAAAAGRGVLAVVSEGACTEIGRGKTPLSDVSRPRAPLVLCRCLF